MADDLFCVQCGHRNSVGDNFCSACGHRLASGGAGDDLTLTLHPLSPEGEPGRRDITVRVVGDGPPVLVLDRGADAGQMFALGEGVTTAGRNPDCTVFLDDAGGIDGVGVLQLNDLMSFNVVFQCKKWEHSVPPKEIRDLRGAMDGRSDKGIFLTTSTYSSNARAEAERPGAVPIELVDGEKLFEMFKRYELGLKPRTVYDINVSFFEQFE